MRSRQHLLETFNKAPRPECAIQNQLLILEVLCDIRDMLDSKQDNEFIISERMIIKPSLEEVKRERYKQESLVAVKKDEPI